MSLGALVKEERLKREMTLKKLAEKIGTSAMYISDIENEKRIPISGEGLKALSIVFNIPLETLENAAIMSRAVKKSRNDDEKSVKDAKLCLARSIIQNSITEEQIQEINRILNPKKKPEGIG